MSEFDKRMSTYKKIAGFMPEKISSDEVAKNNAAVEASTKDQTNAAIAALSKKNAPVEEKPQDQSFKPFSFENAPVYKSLNQEEDSEQNNQNSRKEQQGRREHSENFAQNGQNQTNEQVHPKAASPLIPSIPKPPVNNLQNGAENAGNFSGFGAANTTGTGNPNNNFAPNFGQEQNAPNFANFASAGNAANAANNADAFRATTSASNSIEQNFSNYQNPASTAALNAGNAENFANGQAEAYQPVPYQPENSPNAQNNQNNQNYRQPVPYVDPNSGNSQFEQPWQNAADFSSFQNGRNFQQEQSAQPAAAAPFMPSIPKPPVNNLQSGAENAGNFRGFGVANTTGTGNPNNNFAPNFGQEQNAPNFGNFASAGNAANAANNADAFRATTSASDSIEQNFSNYQNPASPAAPNAGNAESFANGQAEAYQPVPYQPENSPNAQSDLNYQTQAQALQNQGAQAFANLRSALNENYKNTLQSVVQNQQPPVTEQPAQPAPAEIKTSANPVPYKAASYMSSSQPNDLPRYQIDEDEPAHNANARPQLRQNSANAQPAQNSWQQPRQNTVPKKGFWQKLQDAFAPQETEPRAPNLNEPINLRAPVNASKFNQNYAAQTLRNMQNSSQTEQTAAQNQREWADLSRQFAQNQQAQQSQQNFSKITNARSAVGESAREIIPPKDAEGTQFDFAAFAAKQSGSAFEAKKFSAQPLETFYVKKQAQENTEKTKNTVNISGVKTPSGGFVKSDNIFYKIPAGTKDSNARRVAKFLLLIGTDEAAKIIAQLPQDQVEKIVPEIASIRRVDPEEKAQILAEFQGLMTKARESGGVTTARTILEKAFGDQQAQDIMQRAVPYDGGKPFDYLQKFDGEQLTLVLKDESVPVKALVLSQVKPAVAAAVINQMNEKERKETVLRLSRLTKFSPDILSRIDRTLREKAENVKTPVSNSIDGRGALASILRKMDVNSEKNILSNLSLVDGELESDLRKRLFTIDDVIAADDKFLQKKLQAMTDDTIAMIIHGKQPEFRKKILNNISKTRGISVLEEEDARAPYSKKELDRLTNEFMNMLRAAWEKGELMISSNDEEWV